MPFDPNEWIFEIMAIYASIISTATLYYFLSQSRISVRVTAQHGEEAGLNKHMLVITAANNGKKPLTVTVFGVITPEGKKIVVPSREGAFARPELPTRLKEGQACTGYFDLEKNFSYLYQYGKLERVEEIRLETIIPARVAGNAVKAMLAAHPYEEAAYDLYPLENRASVNGIGRVGRLKEPVALARFSGSIKKALGLGAVRRGGPGDRLINTVAVCGGSGGDFWPLALGAGADVLVTGDIGYHGARDMLAAGLNFIDAGHYGTERVVLDSLAGYLEDRCREKGVNVEFVVSGVNGDPFVFA